MDAANKAPSKDPVPVWADAMTSILPAKEDDISVKVVFVTLIDDASEELFVSILLEIESNLDAADELLDVIVPEIEIIFEANDELLSVIDVPNTSILVAADELKVVSVVSML